MEGLATQEGRRLMINDIKAEVQLIQHILKDIMVKDVHYGTIPGTQKPTLYKPGSEKILRTFHIGVDPREDITDLSTDDEVRYRVYVKGFNQITGEAVGVGVGECSSDEEKYKWRRPVCEEEFNETPDDRKRIVWKKDKTGKSFQQKQIRTNPADVANTILKMAKKRSQIDMTLTVTAASDVFEQDLEDLPDELREHITEQRTSNGKPDMKAPQEKSGTPADNKPAREKLKDELELYCMTEQGVDVQKMGEVLTQISKFGDNNGFTLDDLFTQKQDGTYKISDKWVGSAIGNLRKLVEKKG